MPKSMSIDPVTVRKSGSVTIPAIPVNAYTCDLKAEQKKRGDQGLCDILSDMVLIREFETMLDQVKKEGNYQGVAYDHKGPAHLSIGQEAAAVGMACTLGVEDLIFGSHRSHGEILAKGMAAIRRLSDDELLQVMKTWLGGCILKVVEQDFSGSVRDLAVRFLIYGSLAEIFARTTGFNAGLGGSMHAFFSPFGIMPNNALVGGSADIAAGAALFKRVNNKPGLVIANIGDASMGCGPVWEALGFAAMDQYHTLWDEAHRGGLPVIFNFFNNFYGMGGQTAGETMGYGTLARVGAGVSPTALHAERVDGYNPLAVADAIERKRAILKRGEGPVLLDTITYRISGHSPSDASSYREKEEIEAWKAADPIPAYHALLAGGKVKGLQALDAQFAAVQGLIGDMYRKAIDLKLSPRMVGARIGELMFSNKRLLSMAPQTKAETLMAKADNPRVQQIAKKVRAGLVDGKETPKNRVYQFRDAIFEALIDKFHEDATLVAYGEENRDWGGAFACYRGLTEHLPYHRLFNSPISEAAIVGSGVGYALCGGRAVVELMYCDFMGRAGDEIFNQMAKWQAMSAGTLTMPLVLRVSVGAKYGAQHSQDWTALVNHMPGLKVVFPATPYDAKGLLTAALNGSDPVVFFESQRLYDIGEMFVPGGVPEGSYEVEIGKPAKRRDGKDLTIITIGATLYRALEAAKTLETQYGLSAEVWDVRSINPLDYVPLIESVKRTGRVIVGGDACERGSVMQTIATNLTRYCFGSLDAPPVVVGARNWITPAAELEDVFFPQPSWFLDAVHENLLPLPGYTPVSNQSDGEHQRLMRNGI